MENGAVNASEELTDAIKVDELDNLTAEEQALATKLIPLIAARANVQAEANKRKELEKITGQLIEGNKRDMEARMEQWKKEMTPPSADDISTLLSQEYAEFAFKLRDGSGEREFVIRELPLRAELKVLKVIQKTLGARIKEISGITWGASSVFENVNKLISLVPGALETLADCCALCLDPYGEQKITGEWIQDNVGVTRLVSILLAQEKAARYRDFLSLSSRFIPGAMIH